MISRIIAPSLSPNTEPDDVSRAMHTLFSPRLWKTGDAIGQVESWFRNYFGVDTVASCNSGRSAFMLLLKAFSIGAGDEVIVQAFTCVAVPEVVMWAGATPVYVDIDRTTYNIDSHRLENVITSKTKAIVVQHTFGIPAPMKDILSIAKKHRIVVIEDCAHALGSTIEKKKTGSFGDAAFFSFGRDKILSSVFGGIAMINKTSRSTPSIVSTFHRRHEAFPYPSTGWIVQQLLHPVIMNMLVLPLYTIGGIGKLMLVFSQKLHVLSFPVYRVESRGRRPSVFPARMPNGLALLARNQLKKLYRFNVKRQLIAKKYGSVVNGAVYLRYPMYVSEPMNIVRQAKHKGILLGLWYRNVIDPAWVEKQSVGYTAGSCPVAEDVGNHVINLPTYPRMREKDVQAVRSLLDSL